MSVCYITDACNLDAARRMGRWDGVEGARLDRAAANLLFLVVCLCLCLEFVLLFICTYVYVFVVFRLVVVSLKFIGRVAANAAANRNSARSRGIGTEITKHGIV